jgi:hypothetical protein
MRIPRFRVLLFALCCVPIVAGCDELKQLVEDEHDRSPEIEQAAQKLQDALDIPPTSTVVFTGPVEAGSIIAERSSVESPVLLSLPGDSGSYYVFMVDDQPTQKLQHAWRYAWLDLETDSLQVIAAAWPGLILRPGKTPAPFALRESFSLDGVAYTYMTGEGAPDTLDAGHKAAFEPPPPAPAPVHARPLAPARAPVKHALVIDGGDHGGAGSHAREMYAYDAKPMAEWVDSRGFETRHVSQWSGSDNDCFKPTGSISSVRNAVCFAVEDYGDLFTSLGEPDFGCDEFFLYVSSHGTDRASVSICYADGSDNALIGYDELMTIVRDHFPSYVKVTMFFDCCYSGKAISSNRPLIAELCDHLCAFTLLTACDSVKTTPMSGGSQDSATQDFMEGATEDHDGDGVVGDIRDRFMEMESEWGNCNPMHIHCPEGQSWCSLDGPLQVACAEMDGTYQVAVDDLIDPAGHAEFIGDLFAQPLLISVGSVVKITGQAPFVAVTGAVDEQCTFQASGAGVVAGFPDVSVTLSGTYSEDVLSFTYVMGAGGELPQGQAVLYQCTGTRR